MGDDSIDIVILDIDMGYRVTLLPTMELESAESIPHAACCEEARRKRRRVK